MLFKDQCVYPTPVESYTETETEITSTGYKVFVGGSPVTEMKIFRNVGNINAIIDIQNLIEFSNDMFFAYLGNLSGAGVYTVPSPTKSAQVKVYEIVYNKETGSSTETEQGSVTMNNIINGKFGNYFPKQMLDQTASKFVLLTNKYSNGGRVLITRATYDVVTFYALSSCTVRLLNKAGTQIATQSCGANGMYIISLNSAAWGSTLKEYEIELSSGGNTITYDVKISPYLEGLPLSRGGCYAESGEVRFNLFIKHPYGGLDNIGMVNAVGISGVSSRQDLRLQDKTYIHGGSANSFETTTQAASAFSTSSLPMQSEGRFSSSYEAYATSVNELWLAAACGSKTGYLVAYNDDMNTIIDVNIESASASLEEIEGNTKIWKISVSATQRIPFVA